MSWVVILETIFVAKDTMIILCFFLNSWFQYFLVKLNFMLQTKLLVAKHLDK